MIKSDQLQPAFKEMVKCGLSEEKAHQEIGFALSQVNAKDSLRKANIVLLNNAVAQVAYTGLSLNHLKQEAVISDYNEQRKKGIWFLPMYRGLLKVAIMEKAILAANTKVIFEGDEYEINAASFNNPVKHIVKSFGKNRKPVVTYSVVALPSGLEQVALFYEDEYEIVKPKNDKYSPHTNWQYEMRQKSALKRNLKMVSGNGDSKLDHLIALDNLQYNVEPLKVKKETPKSNAKEVNPTLTSTHENYNGIVKAIAKGTHDWTTIEQHFSVSDDVKKAIEDEANKLNSKKLQTV